jgi:uncharacterized protein (TIGR03437 family)
MTASIGFRLLRYGCALAASAVHPPAFAQNASRPVVDAVVTASAFGAFNGVAAPGSYVEIYGSNLAGTTRTWTTGDFRGNTSPTVLDGVTVTINGTAAFVNYVSPIQINIQIPDSIPTGGVAAVVVSYQGASSNAASLTMHAQEPGLLAPASFQVGGRQYVAAIHSAGGSFVANGSVPGVPASPAVSGETLIFYGTGFGPVRQGAVAGQIAVGQTALAGSFAMTIGGIGATVQYAGLAPGLVGLYQFNVVVPANLPSGDLPVAIALGGTAAARQTLYLSVAAPAKGPFTLTSSAGVNGGALPAEYTCDGSGATIPLSWTNPPAGTKEFAVLMTTLPGDGTTKWNWVLYGIPGSATGLVKDTFMAGTLGVGSDGPGQIYNPPCSQGPGTKLYTYTVYALSGSPRFTVPASQVTGQNLTDAIASITLGSASLGLNATRTAAPTGSSANCVNIRNSTRASKSGTASVSCDGDYAYIGSNGITTAPMMNGITSTNLQVPIPVNFNGSRGWKIPINPAIAASPANVLDGPVGVAINGVPIFNPCTQGGCVTGGDTKALGQLDTCNGHAGRADDYHYHAAPTCMMADQPASYWDTHPLGWALDGFAIFGYRDADGTTAQRDNICGGNTKAVPNAPAGYAYHVTDAPPYISSCLIGTPSPDLPNQGSKYRPMRQPPVTPFNVSGMTLTTDSVDAYQVLQFTSAIPFRSTETGTDSYNNPAGTYKIRYKQVLGEELSALLAARQNVGATACWNFQFVNSSGATTQPTVSYCK